LVTVSNFKTFFVDKKTQGLFVAREQIVPASGTIVSQLANEGGRPFGSGFPTRVH
jgi:hypothetical protein